MTEKATARIFWSLQLEIEDADVRITTTRIDVERAEQKGQILKGILTLNWDLKAERLW
jgi:hypothetical protein